MPRATIIAIVDNPGERELADAWIAKWRGDLAFLSPNRGCGCCVDKYDVDGPDVALAEIPEVMRARSDWTNPHGG